MNSAPFQVLAVDEARRTILGVFDHEGASAAEVEAEAWRFMSDSPLPLVAVGVAEEELPAVPVESAINQLDAPLKFGEASIPPGAWFMVLRFDPEAFRLVSGAVARTGGRLRVRPLDGEEVQALDRELRSSRFETASGLQEATPWRR